MPKIKLISQAIAGAILSCALVMGGQVTRAQRPIFPERPPVFMLKAPCANAGPGNWRLTDFNVSIDKAVYRSLFYMGPGNRFASLTCKIREDDAVPIFETLTLGFGMRDNDRGSPSATVNVYLDGERAFSQNVSPAQKVNFKIFDVTNVRDVAIETICNSNSQLCERVYFVDASLERLPPPPKPSN